jgi:hypothetical protein
MFRLLVEIPFIRELWEVHQWKKRELFVENQIKSHNQRLQSSLKAN